MKLAPYEVTAVGSNNLVTEQVGIGELGALRVHHEALFVNRVGLEGTNETIHGECFTCVSNLFRCVGGEEGLNGLGHRGVGYDNERSTSSDGSRDSVESYGSTVFSNTSNLVSIAQAHYVKRQGVNANGLVEINGHCAFVRSRLEAPCAVVVTITCAPNYKHTIGIGVTKEGTFFVDYEVEADTSGVASGTEIYFLSFSHLSNTTAESSLRVVHVVASSYVLEGVLTIVELLYIPQGIYVVRREFACIVPTQTAVSAVAGGTGRTSYEIRFFSGTGGEANDVVVTCFGLDETSGKGFLSGAQVLHSFGIGCECQDTICNTLGFLNNSLERSL